MNDLKELALAAVEAEKHYTVHPAIMAFHDAATPERILQYRNEVLEEVAKWHDNKADEVRRLIWEGVLNDGAAQTVRQHKASAAAIRSLKTSELT
jgi:hypothetical protein